MKKFYAFAAAAVATLSMNAQLYVVGAGEGLGWTPETPLTVELADGAYTFEVKNLTSFKMSTAMGSWDDFNAGILGCSFTEADLGNPLNLSKEYTDNINTPWKGDYKIVVAGDLSTLTMTTDTPKPSGPTPIYMRGGMNNWLNDATPELMAQWQFKQVGETNEYTLVCTIAMGTTFKIADADWAKYNYGLGDTVFAGSEDEWKSGGGDTTMGEDFTGTVTMTLNPENLSAITVKFTEGDSGVDNIAAENAPAEYFNLQGVRVANPENGLYIVRQGSKVSKQLVK